MHWVQTIHLSGYVKISNPIQIDGVFTLYWLLTSNSPPLNHPIRDLQWPFLRRGNQFNICRYLTLRAGRQLLTGLTQRGHYFRFDGRFRLRLLAGNNQALRHHPNVNRRSRPKSHLFQPVALQVQAGATAVIWRAEPGSKACRTRMH